MNKYKKRATVAEDEGDSAKNVESTTSRNFSMCVRLYAEAGVWARVKDRGGAETAGQIRVAGMKRVTH
jgi:hypothetical protein